MSFDCLGTPKFPQAHHRGVLLGKCRGQTWRRGIIKASLLKGALACQLRLHRNPCLIVSNLNVVWSISESWQELFTPCRSALELVYRRVSCEPDIQPALDDVLRAFTLPMESVKVLIVGQDPYPTPGHATGLAFSVPAHVAQLPPTLRNIFREYCDDLGHPIPATGDLAPWAHEGVLLLNRTLTVQSGAVGSHRKIGWEEITQCVIEGLLRRSPQPVAILWGSHAAALAPLAQSPIVSAHPSPLSAYRGFFGSRPFSRANRLLNERGLSPVQWRLPARESVE